MAGCNVETSLIPKNEIRNKEVVVDETLPRVKPLPDIPYFGPDAIVVKDLLFSYENGGFYQLESGERREKKKIVLQNLSFSLQTGSRCLLIGNNGCGKSTLLKIIAGRHLTKPDSAVTVLGLNAYRDTRLNFHRAYLDVEWGMRIVPFAGGNVPLMADIAVRDMMAKLQQSYPERRDTLVHILGINLDWRMHQLSDGQRRRVQIMIGLIRPFKILLLDEITTSLDVCVRQDLLRWLIHETEIRHVTIIYAVSILLYLRATVECAFL
jgi:CCR4-NOT complex subunit CAF16